MDQHAGGGRAAWRLSRPCRGRRQHPLDGSSSDIPEAGRCTDRLRCLMAIISGDGPAQSPWIESWQATIVEWVGHMGGTWNDAAHQSRTTAHEPWFETIGTETFTASVVQSVEDLIDAEHSRAMWARSKMGTRADEFDADLRTVLAPYANDGKVEFGVRSSLKWGRPKSQRR